MSLAKNNKSGGLTIIELLVVISIIAAISTVVLPRLNSARDRGTDTLVKGNLSGLSAQAEIVFGAAGDYATVCSDTKMVESLSTASEKVTGATTNYACYDEPADWAAATPLKRQNQVSATSSVDYWCVDRSGQAVLLDDQLAVDQVTCL